MNLVMSPFYAQTQSSGGATSTALARNPLQIPNPHAHVMVQRLRHSRRQTYPKNRLCDRQRVNVAIASEHLTKQDSSGPGGGHQHRVGKVRKREEPSSCPHCPATAQEPLQVQEEERLQHELLLQSPEQVSKGCQQQRAM